MRFKYIIIGCLFSVLVCLALAAQAKTNGDLVKVEVGPSFTVLAQEEDWLNTSRALTPTDFDNRIVLLDFWTYCCVNCLHTLPDLATLEAEFGERLTVVGVHSAKFSNESKSRNIRDAIIRYDVAHPVVNDADFRLWRSFDVHAWPTLKLIDPRGQVVKTYTGENHLQELRHDISELIKKFPDARKDALPIALEKEKATPTLLQFPAGLAKGELADGTKVMFVSDTGHHRILAVDAQGQILKRIGVGSAGAQDGRFEAAQFHSPQGIVYGNGILYVADTGNHLLRAVDFKQQMVRTLAGTGEKGRRFPKSSVMALSVPLASPWDVAFYPDKNHLAISMTGLQQLWQYDIVGRTVSVLAGAGRENIKDGPAKGALLAQPSGLSALGDALYFVDAETSALRMLKDNVVVTLVGVGLFEYGYEDGPKDTARLQHPLGVEASHGGVYVADSYNHALRRYDAKSRELRTVVTSGPPLREPGALLAVDDVLFIADTNHHRIVTLGADGALIPFALSFPEDNNAAYSEDLPNVQKIAPLSVKEGEPARVKIDLPKGWHVNEFAPSYLAVFDGDEHHGSKAQFDTQALNQGMVALPALAAGNYHLQAVIYYCQDEDASGQCLIAGFDVALRATDNGSTAISLPVALP